ncbi:MAG: metallophosphoesterase family protein, partial [Lachnospiraceae bacterium]|nr:metallophosphoesterase family protein [Lachnospiraceae bacterium]
MKIAIYSDVHGNHPALKKVLEEIEKLNAEEQIIAGDYCLSGAWPDDCIKTLRSIPEKHMIRGNEERYLENLIGKDQSTWTDGQMQISYWNYRNIRRENLDYILSLPQELEFIRNGVKIRVAHASKDLIGDVEFERFGPAVLAEKHAGEEITPERLKQEIREILDSDEAFLKRTEALEDGIYIFGHSHVQWSWRAKDRNLLLINPGSCGLPLDGIRNSLPFDILTIHEDGSFELSERRIPMEMQDYVSALCQTTQYTEAKVWTKVITRELLTSREHLTFFLRFAEDYAGRIGDP